MRGAADGGRLLALVAREQLDDLLAHLVQVGAELDEHLGGDALALADEAEQDVLGADVVVAELQRFAQRQLEHLLGARRERDVPGRLLLTLADDVLHLLAHGVERDAQRLERLGGDTFTLVDETEQDVLGADVVVVEHLRLFLGEHNHTTGAIRESLEHHPFLRPRGHVAHFRALTTRVTRAGCRYGGVRHGRDAESHGAEPHRHDGAHSRGHYGCAMTVDAAPTRATRHRVGRIAAVAGPAALALALALVRNTQIPLWRDEFATALFASLSPADLLAATTHVDAVLAPYYFVMHLLSPALGLGLGMRTVSILAFVGTAAVTAAVALRWWGAIGGAVAGLAVALNGEILGAAVNARPYALSLFFGALALFAADRALRSGRTWTWAGYAAAAAAAVVLQLFAVLAVALIGVLTVGRPRGTVVRWVLCVAAGGGGRRHPPRGRTRPSRSADVARRSPTCARRSVLSRVRLGSRRSGRSHGRRDHRSGRWRSRPPSPSSWRVDCLQRTAPTLPARGRSRSPSRSCRRWFSSRSRSRSPPCSQGSTSSGRRIGAALVLAGAVVLLKRPWTALAVTAGLIALVLLVLSAVVAGIRMVNPPPRGDDFPAAVRTLERSAETGETLVIAQPYAFGGVAYGFAVSAADEAHAAEVADRVVSGSQPMLDVRTITSTDPLRTMDAEAAPSDLTDDTATSPSTWVMTIFPITDEQLETVDPALAECLRSIDFESPTERFGALRLYRLECD